MTDSVPASVPVSVPRGIVLILDEPESSQMSKWIAWITVLFVFIFVLILIARKTTVDQQVIYDKHIKQISDVA